MRQVSWRLWGVFLVAGIGLPGTAGEVVSPVAVEGRVSADVLNVRAAPGTTFEVVAKLARDDVVQIVGRRAQWYEIRIPVGAEAWCAVRLLDDEGRAAADGVRVRSGPGVVFSPYAELPAGATVKTIGAAQRGWQRIVPPAAARAWVSAQFVTADPAKLKALFEPEPTDPGTAVEEVPAEEVAGEPEAHPVPGEADDGPAAADTMLPPEPVARNVFEDFVALSDAEIKTLLAAEQGVLLTKTTSVRETAGPRHDSGAQDAPGHGPEVVTFDQVPVFPEQDRRAGVLLPLAEQITDQATHVLVRIDGRKAYPKALVKSDRVDLNEWSRIEVKIHGVDIPDAGFKFPLVRVDGVQLAHP